MKLYTANETAELLGIELDTLYRYARADQLRGAKIGKLWRFSQGDIETFIDEHRRSNGTSRQASGLLPDALARAARRGDRSGVISSVARTSYAEIHELSDRLAGGLLRGGVRPGDRVAVILPNSIDFVVACFAVWKARGVLVADDPTIRPANLRHMLADATPTALILNHELAQQLDSFSDVLSDVRLVLVKDRGFAAPRDARYVTESLDAILESPARFDEAGWRSASSDEPASITYTSGSTGQRKGVVHSHESWLVSANFTRDHARLSSQDLMAVSLPLHHGYALRQLLAYVLAGGSLLIADIYQVLRLLPQHRPTALLLVPAACNIVLDHFAGVLREAAAHLRYLEIGTAALPAQRLAQLRALLPHAAIHLPYGLTEARVGFLKPGPDGALNRLETISPGLAVELIDADGNPVPPGETGEIRLRGPGLMTGYWGRPAAEQEILRTEGFRTGDMGRRDQDGSIALLGRCDDMLKIGGRKVNPAEVELALNQHPGVAESAVLAVEGSGGALDQELSAFIVLRSGHSVSESELRAHCRRQVEPYKVPARFTFRSSLPKSTVGKILRRALLPESADN